MKILLADDEDIFRTILETLLAKWGYDVVVARDGNEAWRILQSADAPRLALLDWRMPGMEGVEICNRIRKEKHEPYTYIILLTAQQRDEDLLFGMESGADDYITKPFNHNELKVRLRAGRRIIELQNELLAAREILRKKASHDALTGLWNHGEILGLLRQEVARNRREGTCISVIMADIDFFKGINDTYGHMLGDEVLRLTALRMQELARSYDFIGRYGGDEFMFVLPGCCEDNAFSYAERLRSSLESSTMDTSEGTLTVTISLGVTTSDCDDNRDAESLVKAADAALYQAKKNGRNRVELASNTGIPFQGSTFQGFTANQDS